MVCIFGLSVFYFLLKSVNCDFFVDVIVGKGYGYVGVFCEDGNGWCMKVVLLVEW